MNLRCSRLRGLVSGVTAGVEAGSTAGARATVGVEAVVGARPSLLRSLAESTW